MPFSTAQLAAALEYTLEVYESRERERRERIRRAAIRVGEMQQELARQVMLAELRRCSR